MVLNSLHVSQLSTAKYSSSDNNSDDSAVDEEDVVESETEDESTLVESDHFSTICSAHWTSKPPQTPRQPTRALQLPPYIVTCALAARLQKRVDF